jgi:hypothetical protein
MTEIIKDEVITEGITVDSQTPEEEDNNKKEIEKALFSEPQQFRPF